MSADRVLRIAAAVIVDADGRLLVVRKTGTTAFMQPGGKLESGETGAECLVRELEEELALRIDVAALEPLGRFAADAANEAGWTVDCEVFRWADFETPARVSLVGEAAERPARDRPAITVQAEIAEARWASRPELLELSAAGRLAPLTRDNLDQFLGG